MAGVRKKREVWGNDQLERLKKYIAEGVTPTDMTSRLNKEFNTRRKIASVSQKAYALDPEGMRELVKKTGFNLRRSFANSNGSKPRKAKTGEISIAVRPVTAFKAGVPVVVPGTGVMVIQPVESTQVAGVSLQMRAFIPLDRKKAVLRVPVSRLGEKNIRHPVTEGEMDKVLAILDQSPRRQHKLWSKQAETFRALLNSPQIENVVSVLRDTYGALGQSHGTLGFSIKEMGDQAVMILASEYAHVKKVSLSQAYDILESRAKSNKAAPLPEPPEQDPDVYIVK